MMTEKELFLETIKKGGGNPDRLVNGWSVVKGIPVDPCTRFLRGNRIRGTDSYDQWGTFISFPEDQPAAVPIVTTENQIIQDIEHWEDYVRVPDLIANCSDGWEDAVNMKKQVEEDGYISAVVMGTGIFEQLHMLMTFEDTLCNMVLYPDQIRELIEVIADYRMTYFKLIVENLHPELIISHDDWGTNAQLFMSPEMWRDYFKEPYRRFYDYLHENDVIAMHHADSYCEPIVEDMADIGVDIWQGVLPSNDIVGMTERLNGRMALMGGWNSAVDRQDATEEEVRKETRRVCEEYGHLKMFIPCVTYGGPSGTLYPELNAYVVDEINRYNMEKYGHCMNG